MRGIQILSTAQLICPGTSEIILVFKLCNYIIQLHSQDVVRRLKLFFTLSYETNFGTLPWPRRLILVKQLLVSYVLRLGGCENPSNSFLIVLRHWNIFMFASHNSHRYEIEIELFSCLRPYVFPQHTYTNAHISFNITASLRMQRRLIIQSLFVIKNNKSIYQL